MRLVNRVRAVGGVVTLTLAATLTVLYFWDGKRNANAQMLTPDDPSVVQHGVHLYRTHCASCHGVSLEGQPNWRVRDANNKLPAPPHDATGHTWHHPDELLFKITKYGTEALVGGAFKSDMLGFGDAITDDEIVAILSYIKSTWPADVQRQHDEINKRAISQ